MPDLIISRNVLCAALAWMGAPGSHIRRASKVLTSEKNTAVQQVTIAFDRWELHQWLKTTDFADSYPRTLGIVAAIGDCFCNDVVPLVARYISDSHDIEIDLLLTLSQDHLQ